MRTRAIFLLLHLRNNATNQLYFLGLGKPMERAPETNIQRRSALKEVFAAREIDVYQPIRQVRAQWVDGLKGLGIFLVVLGHALGGLIDADVAPAKDWFRPLFAAIYVFHMPLFFFLVGIFVADRIQRDANRFRKQLFSSILWPYFLWAGFQTVAIYFAGNLVNSPSRGLSISLLQLFYVPPSQFWFLYGIFFLHGAAYLLGKRATDPLFFVALLVAGSLAEVADLPPIWRAVMQMAPYYGIGVLFGSRLLHGEVFDANDHKLLFLVPVAILAIFMSLNNALAIGDVAVWPQTSAGIVADVNGFQNFYAATLAVAALMIIAVRLAPYLPNWLIYCGRQTMPIFVLHILFIATSRIVALKLYPDIPPGLLLAMLWMVGIGGPLVAALVARRLGWSRALGFA
jgi:fucose 4-O-acetylase-like acetyltransferase